MSDVDIEPRYTQSPPRAIRVKTSQGWQDLAIQGAPGAPGLPRFDYLGAWSAAGSYAKGQLVVRNGVTYMCVRDTTTQPPASWPSIATVPTPIVNGQWLKGVGGAPAWQAIAKTDLPAFVATDIPGLVTADTAWHVLGAAGEPAFQNGYTNYGAPYGPAKFRKLASGLVVLEGLVFLPGTTGTQVMFALPAGYRPMSGRALIFMTARSYSANLLETIRVFDNGNVECQSNPGGGWLSLAGVSYYADA